MAERQTQAA